MNDRLRGLSKWHKSMTFCAILIMVICSIPSLFVPTIVFVMVPLMFIVIFTCSSVAVSIDEYLERNRK